MDKNFTRQTLSDRIEGTARYMLQRASDADCDPRHIVMTLSLFKALNGVSRSYAHCVMEQGVREGVFTRQKVVGNTPMGVIHYQLSPQLIAAINGHQNPGELNNG